MSTKPEGTVGPAMKKNVFSTLAIATSGSILGLLSGVTSVQATSLIGIDFDTRETPPPLNWNQMSPSDSVLTNLISENGAATGVTLTRIGNTPNAAAATIPPEQIPSHSPSLEALDGFFEGSGLTTYRFNNLDPGADYWIWVFSFNKFDFDNNVSFISIFVPDSFNVAGSNKLFVNSEPGNSDRTLSSYALRATAWQSASRWPGTIRILVDDGPSSDFWGLAGLAIQKVPVSVPEPSALLGLGLMLGVMGLSKKSS